MGYTNESYDRIAQKILAPQGGDNMPVILCRRYVPHARTYLLFDAGWEGLKKAVRGGSGRWEIDLDFQLRIEVDGLCAIPDTKNNRAKLEIVSKPIVSYLTHDPITGIEYPEPVKHVSLPEYTRVEQSILEKAMVDDLYKQVMQRMADEAAEKGAPEPIYARREDNRPGRVRMTEVMPVDDGSNDFGTDDEEASPPAASTRMRREAKVSAKTKAKGRGKARDPLLEPI